jgi:hypothetical protein
MMGPADSMVPMAATIHPLFKLRAYTHAPQC